MFFVFENSYHFSHIHTLQCLKRVYNKLRELSRAELGEIGEMIERLESDLARLKSRFYFGDHAKRVTFSTIPNSLVDSMFLLNQHLDAMST